MRIIAGKFKGRTITTSAPSGVRPTTDRARETIFNILNTLIDFEGIRVLDLCAGTGALGLEALSRGAEYCCFVELSHITANLLHKTLVQFTVEPSQYNVVTMDSRLFVSKFSRSAGQPFDLIFTDPPYKNKLINPLFKLLKENQLLVDGGLFVAEHDIREIVLQPEGFEKINTRQFGETVVDFFGMD
ncbi:MAG: 16S rRNA (guanine(966)-N(2))-methyltransferase RsmD [Bacteroidetes bacterium]|nr:16S rRNA (guanine(966)-N(2))-methyltransferase RsmD [Bacteroidota bacterium]